MQGLRKDINQIKHELKRLDKTSNTPVAPLATEATQLLVLAALNKQVEIDGAWGTDANNVVVKQLTTVNESTGAKVTSYVDVSGNDINITAPFTPSIIANSIAIGTMSNLLSQINTNTDQLEAIATTGFAQNNTSNASIISELQSLNTAATNQSTALNTINTSIQEFKTEAHTDSQAILTQLQTTDVVIDNLLVQATAINANTDNLETLQTATNTAIANLQTATNNFATQNTTDLNAIVGAQNNTNTALNNILTEAQAINLNTNQLETLISNNTTAINGFNTSTQGNLATIITNTGNTVTELQTANTTLTNISGFVDGLEQGQTDLQTTINNFATANDGNFTQVDAALASLNTTQTNALTALNTLVTQTDQLEPLLTNIKAFYEGNFTITGATSSTFPYVIMGGIYSNVSFKVRGGRVAFQGAEMRSGDSWSSEDSASKLMAAASITSVSGNPSISITFKAY